jgi:Tfp pilus assembly protein PilF
MNPAPDDSDPPPGQSNRRWLVLGGVAVAILTAGFFCARPVYRQFKQWRSGRLAEESVRWLAQNDLGQAQAKAQAALLLAPGEPRALRAMALALTRATNVAALQFWAQLIQTGRAGESDRRAFVEQSIRAGAAGPAMQELRRLLDEAPGQSANLWLASQLFTLLNDRAQTVHYAAQAAASDPTNRQYNLFFSSLEFDALETAVRDTARSNVWACAQDGEALGLQAMGFLARRADLTPAQRQQLVSLLRQHPWRTTTQDLLALGLELAGAPGRRGELLDQALERFKVAGPEARIQLAVWLNQNGEFERTLAALPLAEARQRKDFFLPYIDALASLGRWAELQKLFEAKQTPLEPAYAEAFRARCEAQLKSEALADLHWRAAWRAAERNPEQLTWLALYAEKCGELDLAKKSLRSLIACVQNPQPAFRELARLTERSGPTVELRDLLDEMLRRWPNDPALQNDCAYLNLLLGAELAASCQAAERLVNQFPESLPYRTTFALALYRQKDFSGARRTYAGRESSWSQALPGQRAVYAAVLAAGGQLSAARELARSLPLSQLRAEELELVQPLL